AACVCDAVGAFHPPPASAEGWGPPTAAPACRCGAPAAAPPLDTGSRSAACLRPSMAGGTVHFGVILPQFATSWSSARELAQAADEAGLDSVWVVDHFVGIPDER